MRLTLVSTTMSSGGAERVMSIIANYWSERGREVILITVDAKERDFYELHKDVKRVALCLLQDSKTVWEALAINYLRVMRLRAAIRRSKPDIVISFVDKMNVLTLIATLGLSIPVVVSEHTDPRQIPPDGVWNLLRRWTYMWADRVIVLTSELKEVLAEFVRETRVQVIPNPAIDAKENSDEQLSFDLPSPCVVAMGRLHHVKGFDILLDAFSRCGQTEWSLIILGEGPARKRLELLVRRYGLQDRVLLPGLVRDPAVVLRKGDLFVLSSRSEGFPMALLEAMSCGLPVVSFDCPTGPGEIIENQVSGVLVPPEDVQSLADAIVNLMNDQKKRESLAQEAQNVTERFSIDKVMELWNNVLQQALAGEKY